MSFRTAKFYARYTFEPIRCDEVRVGDLIANGATVTSIYAAGELHEGEPIPTGKVRLVTGSSGWRQSSTSGVLVIGRLFDRLAGAS